MTHLTERYILECYKAGKKACEVDISDMTYAEIQALHKIQEKQGRDEFRIKVIPSPLPSPGSGESSASGELSGVDISPAQ